MDDALTKQYTREMEDYRKAIEESVTRGVRNVGIVNFVADALIEHTLGGHYWRGLLGMATYGLLKGDPYKVVDTAAGIELNHAATLVIDDSPNFDNATMRRGRQSFWKEHGETLATLAPYLMKDIGRGMVLRNAARINSREDASYILEISDLIDRTVYTLANAEIEDALPGNHTEEQIVTITRDKNDIMSLAIRLGERLNSQTQGYRDHIERIASGLAYRFQQRDDIKDIEEDMALGKQTTATRQNREVVLDQYRSGRLEVIENIAQIREHSFLEFLVAEKVLPEM